MAVELFTCMCLCMGRKQIKSLPTDPILHVIIALQAEEQIGHLVQMRHWLTDSQREYSGSIDITDADIIRRAQRKQQVKYLPLLF